MYDFSSKSGLLEQKPGLSRPTPVIDREQLRRIAPSVFATHPWEGNAAHNSAGVSSRYMFVPTIDIIDGLADRGFYPVRAAQSTTRIPGKGDFTRHYLRFRHESKLGGLPLNGEVAELALINSHDRTSQIELALGIFRLACLNGMVVHSADMGEFKVRHTGNDDVKQEVIDTTFRIMEDSEKVAEKIGEWKQLQLEPPQRRAFAEAALELKESKIVTPEKLLLPRRPEDRNMDLWTTANVVQEHMIRGGDKGRASTGRRATTRGIKSVSEDVRLNRVLWRLTEEMAKHIKA